MTRSSKKRSPLFQFLARHLFHHFVLPTKKMIVLAFAGALAVAIGYALGAGTYLLWITNGALFLLSLLDWITMPKRREIQVTRSLPEEVDIGQPVEIGIEVHNASGQTILIRILDDLPLVFAPMEPLVSRVQGKRAALQYQTVGQERGKYVFAFLYVRFSGWLGLWEKQIKISQEQAIKVLPDLSAVRGYLASMQESLVLDGQRIYKRQNSGTEFHAIREYVTDDDPRKVNWSATARAGKLMTNLYRPERGKIVTILLDCGRMMGVELDSRVKLDRSLEAALTLAAVALRQGDQVAVLAYSSEIKAYIPPNRGIAHLHTIIETVYDLRSDFVESNHAIALSYLHRYLKKRSMLVLFSDMESYLLEDQLQAYLLRLRKTHALLLLSLQDPLLFAWSRIPLQTKKDAYIKSMARKFLHERNHYKQKMIAQGIQVLDVPADQLALSVVNSYLELKSREVL
ncbi:DUF58 domain-containing protein [Brevibacillus migulae]|uniref:DUF58 domain-containing protein n=1 Tax=Brevibacillus migulae TaxID=1644114 RepID=UPI00106E58E2|nr:DUF58 domain-containing protein [Brevibacillus migulae]